MDRVPPPVIHMHLRIFDVSTSVPIGDLTHTDASKLPPTSTPTLTNGNGHAHTHTDTPAHVIEVDVPERERVRFDEWLRNLWREKDAKFEEYHTKGGFSSKVAAVEIPLRIRRKRDALNVVCYFAPVLFALSWWQLSKASC
jgi:hypothetical protein